MNRTMPAVMAAMLILNPEPVVAEQPSTDTPGAEPSADAPADATPADAAAKTETAGASQPQVPLFRGGSLGLPTPSGSTSVQAAAVGTLAGERSVGKGTVAFDFFTKVGGIVLDEDFAAEVVGESFKLDVPQLTVGAPGALPAITTTDLTSAGLRLTYRPSARPYKVFAFDPITAGPRAEDGAISATARHLFDGSTGWAFSLGGRVLHPVLTGTDAKIVGGGATEFIVQRTSTQRSTEPSCDAVKRAQEEAAKKSELAASFIASVVARTKQQNGLGTLATDQYPADKVPEALAVVNDQVVAQSVEDRAASVALTGACKLADRRSTFFVSLAATYLNSQRLPMDGGLALSLPRFIETRASIGWERQSGRQQLGLLLPRVGAYATLAHANWHNTQATTPEQMALDDVSDWQAEFAIYASGHFSGGFSGLISIGVLAPYGNGREMQAFINVAPSIGAAIGGGA